MEPGLDRASILPFAGSREEGNLQLAAPGFVYDAARAFVTPGMAARGQQVSDEDILNTAMNVMGGGAGASRVAGPRTAPDEMLLGMGVGSRGADDALDMSTEARIRRAAEQGFDTRRPLYHGTSSSFDEFAPSTVGDLGAGNYLTPDPEKASSYATIRKYMRRSTNNAEPNVLPLYVKDKLKYLDLQGKGILPFDESRITRLKSAGYDAIRQFDDNGNLIQINVFDPSNIRSVYAAFDPAKRDSSNITFAKGGLASKSNVERVNNDNRRYLG
jgi:hypothetical protein